MRKEDLIALSCMGAAVVIGIGLAVVIGFSWMGLIAGIAPVVVTAEVLGKMRNGV